MQTTEMASTMKRIERSFQEFIDAIQTAEDEVAFERVAHRASLSLGFRWFAYLRVANDVPTVISSYPKSWTGRYLDSNYQDIDPVVRRARRAHDLFRWGGSAKTPQGTREQKRLFDEAATFGIRSGLTVPIRGGFGQVAAFSLATDEEAASTEKLVRESGDILQLIGLYFHAHLNARRDLRVSAAATEAVLTQRELQCLTWCSRGKTVADIAVLVDITPRTVAFHLENARRKFQAASIAQCVAEALRRGLLT